MVSRNWLKALSLQALALSSPLVMIPEYSPSQSSSISTFTYQGRLTVNGSPVTDGNYEFRFRLYDTATVGTGSQLGAVTPASPTTYFVKDGYFTVPLAQWYSHFSAGVARWIEIEVKGPGDSAYKTIGRQQITASPMAMFAESWGGSIKNGAQEWALTVNASGDLEFKDNGVARISFDDGGKVGIGTTTPGELVHIRSTQNPAIKIENDSVDERHWRFLVDQSGHMKFDDDGGVRGVLQRGGILGLGTTAPVAKLSVVTSANTDVARFQYGSPGNASAEAAISLSNSGSGSTMTLGHNIRKNGGNYSLADTSQPGWMILTDTNASVGAPFGDRLSVVRAPASTGTPSLQPLLTITRHGNVQLFEHTDGTYAPNWIAFGVQLYVGNGGSGLNNEQDVLYAREGATGTASRLSSHADPRSANPNAITSFDDPTIDLPYSFQHSNVLTGKGSIVDVAKALKWVEGKMQAELGTEAGRVFHYYDLPPEAVISATKHLNDLVDHHIQEKLSKTSPIEVPLGADGSLPASAWEEVEVVELVEGTATETTKVIDWNTNKVVAITEEVRGLVEVDTGAVEKRLCKGYFLEDGKLYRKATIEDITIEAADIPTIPDWVAERLPSGASLDVDGLIQDGLGRARARELEQSLAAQQKKVVRIRQTADSSAR